MEEQTNNKTQQQPLKRSPQVSCEINLARGDYFLTRTGKTK